MDFVIDLPHSFRGFDFIWVIMDRITKSGHFFLVKTTYNASRYAKFYVHEIIRLYEIPVSIISDHGPQFKSYY